MQEDMAGVAMINYGLDPGMFVCMMSGEYIGAGWNVNTTLEILKVHSNKEDWDHIHCISLWDCLLSNCSFEESTISKVEMIRHGDQKNLQDNPKKVKKTFNREDKHSHLILIPKLILDFSSPYCHHNSQGIVIKLGKNN